MAVDLLAPSIEIGVVTTNLDAMVAFYEGFLGLTHQGDLDFPGGTMKRYAVGSNVLKLVTYDVPPAAATAPGGMVAVATISPPLPAAVRRLATQESSVAHSPTPTEMRTLFTEAGFDISSQRRVERPLWTRAVWDLITVGISPQR